MPCPWRESRLLLADNSTVGYFSVVKSLPLQTFLTSNRLCLCEGKAPEVGYSGLSFPTWDQVFAYLSDSICPSRKFRDVPFLSDSCHFLVNVIYVHICQCHICTHTCVYIHTHTYVHVYVHIDIPISHIGICEIPNRKTQRIQVTCSPSRRMLRWISTDKTQQHWSIIICKMDNRAWELGFVLSLLYESAVCCFFLLATFAQCIFC